MIALPEPGAVPSGGLGQTFGQMERGVLEHILERPKPKDPGQWPEYGGELLAVLDRRVGGASPAQSRPKKPYQESGQDPVHLRREVAGFGVRGRMHVRDRKSTRLNSSHLGISYAVFCLKK